MAKSSQSDPEHRRDGFARLLRLYETWGDLAPNAGKSSQAAEWKQKLAAFEQDEAAKKEWSPERAELEALKAKPLPTVVATLVPPDSEWKWLHPIDGVDPVGKDADFHSTFFSPDFDDSGWKTGKDSADSSGGFGYGRDFTGVDIGTPENPEHRHSAYFRHRFTTDKPQTSLELRCQRDDALVVYLDGKEVLRDNLPDGPDAYLLSASVPQGPDNDGVIHRFPLPSTLEPGEHVLALSVHNAAPTSSDLRLGAITLVEVEVPSAE
jgi:hypothetical protein